MNPYLVWFATCNPFGWSWHLFNGLNCNEDGTLFDGEAEDDGHGEAEKVHSDNAEIVPIKTTEEAVIETAAEIESDDLNPDDSLGNNSTSGETSDNNFRLPENADIPVGAVPQNQSQVLTPMYFLP